MVDFWAKNLLSWKMQVSNLLEGVENPTTTVLFNKTDMLQVRALHCIWYSVSRTLFVKGLNQMSEGLTVSCPVIAKMTLFVN